MEVTQIRAVLLLYQIHRRTSEGDAALFAISASLVLTRLSADTVSVPGPPAELVPGYVRLDGSGDGFGVDNENSKAHR